MPSPSVGNAHRSLAGHSDASLDAEAFQGSDQDTLSSSLARQEARSAELLGQQLVQQLHTLANMQLPEAPPARCACTHAWAWWANAGFWKGAMSVSGVRWAVVWLVRLLMRLLVPLDCRCPPSLLSAIAGSLVQAPGTALLANCSALYTQTLEDAQRAEGLHEEALARQRAWEAPAGQLQRDATQHGPLLLVATAGLHHLAALVDAASLQVGSNLLRPLPSPLVPMHTEYL